MTVTFQANRAILRITEYSIVVALELFFVLCWLHWVDFRDIYVLAGLNILFSQQVDIFFKIEYVVKYVHFQWLIFSKIILNS